MIPLQHWLVGLLAAGGLPGMLVAAPRTNPVIVLTVENKVEVQRANALRPDPAYVNQVLDPGDRGRTYAGSRVSLRMPDLSVARFNENSVFQIEAPPTAKPRTSFNLFRGMAYFFHRGKPVEVKVMTPGAIAAIRGTEFVIQFDQEERTTIALLDGEVELSNLAGQSILMTNQALGVVEREQAPRQSPLLNAVAPIQWCLYYPAVLDAEELPWEGPEKQAISDSLAAYRKGDLLRAFEKYPSGRTPQSGAERLFLSGILLSVGQVDRSMETLRALTPSQQEESLAGVLRMLVATVQSRRPPELSNLATNSASWWMARSYLEQSRSRLQEALDAARRAVQLAPHFSFAWARVAELEFSFGRIGAAGLALEKSLAVGPRNAQALTLKGFLLSAEGRTREALAQFDQAIDVDGALANAWLGRGLCHFRRGEREAGRAELQTAAALEPNRSVLRSYLGKALLESGEPLLAEEELRLAKKLDPQDPTPWLYSALQDRQNNRINRAVEELQTSMALNENRSVYRSKLMLDEDRAVRSANLADIYRSAGLKEVSLWEAARAVNADYGNFSAHLFLAESYDVLRDPTRFNLRYETAWFNERLLANLLAPVGGGPLSQHISQQEYSRFFEGNRLGFSSQTDYRSDGIVRETASQFGTFHKTSYALDVDYQHNEGVRPNNDLSRLEWYTTVKQQLTPQDSVLLLAKYQDYHSGDNFQYYDPASARPNFKFDEDQEPILVAGYHREWTPGIHTLALGGRLVNDQEFSDRAARQAIFFRDPAGNVVANAGLDFDVHHETELEIFTTEVNQIFQTERQTLVVGGRFQAGEFETHSTLFNPASNGALFNSPPADAFTDEDFQRASGYGYYTLRLPTELKLTGGAAYDYLEYPENFRSPPIKSGEESRHRWSPKAALVWDPFPLLTLRGIYTKSLGGVSLDESYRLEPVQLAGFSQAFRTLIPESLVGSVSAPDFETFGAAIDLKFKTRTYFGVQGEILESKVRHTMGVFDYNNFTAPIVPSDTREHLDYKEHTLAASIHQLMAEEWSLGAQYRFSRAELNSSIPELPAYLRESQRDVAELHEVTVYGLFNHPSGFFARAESQWYWQNNGGVSEGLDDDSFVQVNLYVGYRFPRQHASIMLGVMNLNDADYRLNPLNIYTELPRERVFFARVLLNF